MPRFARKTGWILTLTVAFWLALVPAVWSQNEAIRDLLPVETASHQIILPPDNEAVLKELGFERLVLLMESDQAVEALNNAYLLGIRMPVIWEEPVFLLLLAEIYFRLGIDTPQIQFDMAKPLYKLLMNRYPRWENQPLVMYRLATIYDRQGYRSEAISHFGLLIDWYPNDALADKARLGLVMSSLRDGRLQDTEVEALAVLDSSQDAQVRFHATIGLAIARHRQGNDQAAAADFLSVIKWPENQPLLESFELFAFAETMRLTGHVQMAREAFLAFIENFPTHEDRPMAVWYLAEFARQDGRFDDAILGYSYLIGERPESRAGMQARLALAALHREAFGDERDAKTEQYLLTVYEQNDYFDLQQQAALGLADYYLKTERPLNTLPLAAGVFDNPGNIQMARQALRLIMQAFSRVISSYPDHPLMISQLFNDYRKYISAPALPRVTFEQLCEILYENLLADTLVELTTQAPLADKFPYRAAFYAALGEKIRGHADEAMAHLRRLVATAGEKKNNGPPPSLLYRARIVWADLLREKGRLRPALSQLALARSVAGDTIDEARLELLAGKVLLADGEAAAAADRLANALRLLDEAGSGDALETMKSETMIHLAEALVRSRRYERARSVWQDLLQREISPHRRALAEIRLDYLARQQGKPLPPEDESAVDAADDFWTQTEQSLADHWLWMQQNENRFDDEPVWERLP